MISQHDEVIDVFSKSELYNNIYYLQYENQQLQAELNNTIHKLDKNMSVGPLLFFTAVAAAVLWFKTPTKRPFCHLCNPE